MELVVQDVHVFRAVGPDAEAHAAQAIVAQGHALGAAFDEDARVHVGEVVAPVAQVAVLDQHVAGTD
ncbi:hypothetical protein D3C77_702010 [compost metagenome]